MEPLTVALPKGRMQDEVLELFRAVGYTFGEAIMAAS